MSDHIYETDPVGPFEDALKLHEACGGAVGSSVSSAAGGVRVLEDQWPSPPRRRAPVAPNEEQLRRETWYHSRMSRRDAERLLVRDGDFLVRESTTNPGQYVLTGMHCGLPKHLLLVDPEGVVSLAARENSLVLYKRFIRGFVLCVVNTITYFLPPLWPVLHTGPNQRHVI